MSAQAAADFSLRRWPPDEALPRFSIRLDAGMLMETSITAGLEALRRRGLEVGGLLLGSFSGNEIVADSLEPVASAYPEGPSYRVPEHDLDAALEREIVGFYRSRTDGLLELDEQDRLLLRLLPGNRPVAILLVRQTKQTAAEARLGFDRDGTIIWSKSIVPFAAWLAGTVDPDAIQSPSASGDVLVMDDRLDKFTIPAASPPAASDSEAAPARFRLRRRDVFAAGCVAAVVFLMTVVLRDTAGDDRSRSAATEVPLFRAEEAAIKVETAAATAPPGRAAAPVRVETARAVPNALPRSSGRTGDRMPEPPAAVTPSRQPADRLRGSTDTAGLFREPGSPPVVAVPSILPGVPVTLPQTALAPPPRPLTPSPAANAPSAVAPVQFVPPVLSRQSSPVIVPPDLRRVIQHEVVLSLRVAVDETGNVISITPVNRLDRAEQALARSYSAAIQTWQFDPAKRNGIPARGETILNFRITPGTQGQ
jgi:hypothetical protein